MICANRRSLKIDAKSSKMPPIVSIRFLVAEIRTIDGGGIRSSVFSSILRLVQGGVNGSSETKRYISSKTWSAEI